MHVGELYIMFLACDGDVVVDRRTIPSVVVCRGNFRGGNVGGSMLLVDGDVDLTRANKIESNLIRATGKIELPKTVKPVNCTIEPNTKDATAPYKFFELSDVGLNLADEKLVVAGVKEGTPFGNCGIAKGDLIRAVDDVPVRRGDDARKLVRRALVRQGDCLITVVRGDKTIDLPVFFPLPR